MPEVVPSVPPLKLPALHAKGLPAVGANVPLLPPVPAVAAVSLTVFVLEVEETPTADPLQLVMAELRCAARVVVELEVA